MYPIRRSSLSSSCTSLRALKAYPLLDKCWLTGFSSLQTNSKSLPFCIHLNQHEYCCIFGPSRSDIRWEEVCT
ncbi:hypothetical protein EUGRSUZ_C01318 [Eucalyptus grandis]|uniref:Uncharacterized protein n=2 Tax=Eucalyptus grandis TaxID=71139 RepID=A0ACC3LCB5_EUCGR|nr:hypothetical protein EUGRSUZ_C01318 [Eucalyptus grandis]